MSEPDWTEIRRKVGAGEALTDAEAVAYWKAEYNKAMAENDRLRDEVRGEQRLGLKSVMTEVESYLYQRVQAMEERTGRLLEAVGALLRATERALKWKQKEQRKRRKTRGRKAPRRRK
jgi:hypothetical protein